MSESIAAQAIRPRAAKITAESRGFLSQLGQEGCEWASQLGTDFCNDLTDLFLKYRPQPKGSKAGHVWSKKGGARSSPK